LAALESACPAYTVLVALYLQLALRDVLIEGTFPGMGTLGKGTGIVGVVGAALAQRLFPTRTV